jgi:serine/threonine protein kinase
MKLEHLCLKEKYGNDGKYNNEIVAIKLFKKNNIRKKSRRFKKELKLISKLKNNNIINFIGYIIETHKIGIVLEFCELKTLKF